MALQLSYNLDTGFSANYWKINTIILRQDSVEFTALLFKDSQARLDNKSPIRGQSYSFSGEDNPCSISAMNVEDVNPFILCYNKLKTLSEFENAVDC